MLQVFFLIFMALLISAAVAGVSAAPWLPTKPSQRRKLLEQLPLKGNEKIYDLGCGDGSLLFAIAKKHPGIRAIGADISLLPLAIGWIRRFVGSHKGSPYANVRLRFANLFTVDVHDADVVFIFLLSKAYPRLKTKFAKELRDDARVVVEAWPLPDMEPASTIRAEGLLPVYIYSGKQFRM